VGTTAASAKYRSTNDPSHKVQQKFLFIDTPGHGKLRHHAFSAVADTKNLKGIIFVVDAANLPVGEEGLRQAAEYLHDILLMLQKRSTATKSSKSLKEIEILIAANKMDLFTAQPSAIVKSLLEKEIGKVRNSKSKGLLESGIETGGSLDDVDNDYWLGETGSTQFKFEQLVEFNISIEVAGGCAVGENQADVQKWWKWVGDRL
jgi:signal recognition particle receptor subunit beta